MYKVGDYIIYGSTGVCRVEQITTKEDSPSLRGIKSNCKYYVLQPLYQSGVIYTPAEKPKVFMRRVISEEKAKDLIKLIPDITAEPYHSSKLQELDEHYRVMAETHECVDLMKLTMSAYAKKQSLEQQNHKLGQVDERYLKRAEELLHGEFAVALGIPKDEVPAYIAERVTSQGGE